MVYRIGGLGFIALGALLGTVGLLRGGQAVLRLGFGAVAFALLGVSCYLTATAASGSDGRLRDGAGPQDHDGDVV
jgi:hypothetical protein